MKRVLLVLIFVTIFVGFKCLSGCNCAQMFKECQYPGGPDAACICLYHCPD